MSSKALEVTVKKKDLFLCLFFICFWTIPHFYRNLTLKEIPLIPEFLSDIYSTSNLFTKATYIWPVPYIQVLEEGGVVHFA